MSLKSRFVGVRLEPEQQRKLIVFSVRAGEPGNVSAGLRWALEQAAAKVREFESDALQRATEDQEAIHA